MLFFCAVNLAQVAFTTLTSDEGYYWYLSTRLQWGYYDHPPLLPLLISLGRHVFSGELGVRFVNVMLMCTGLVFLVKLLEETIRHTWHLYLIVFSLPLFNYITFIVFPDTPLVALSMIFLYFYKRFLDKNDYLSSFVMGLILALMLYAKYHAVLFILFILLSNLSLLKNKKFLVVIGLASILYVPHLYWQYVHHFVSFQYHLVGRSSGFKIDYLTEFLSVQTLMLGPALLFAAFKIKTNDAFRRSLKFIVLGTLLFFCLATLKGYVQFHWTSIVLFPLIILGALYYADRKKAFLYWTTIPLLGFVLFVRLYLAFSFVPVNTFNRVDYFHGRELWAQDIYNFSGEKPVVFENQLREAPLYSFYSGMDGVALYPGESKKCQYELWNSEDRLQGKDITLVKYGRNEHCTKLKTRMGKEINYVSIKKFASYLDIKINLIGMKVTTKHDSAEFRIEIVNHRSNPLTFAPDNYGEPVRLLCVFHNENGGKDSTVLVRELSPRDQIASQSKRMVCASIPLPASGIGPQTVSFGFDDGEFAPSSNSKRYDCSFLQSAKDL